MFSSKWNNNDKKQVSIHFDDATITMDAVEVCINHLYGGFPKPCDADSVYGFYYRYVLLIN